MNLMPRPIKGAAQNFMRFNGGRSSDVGTSARVKPLQLALLRFGGLGFIVGMESQSAPSVPWIQWVFDLIKLSCFLTAVGSLCVNYNYNMPSRFVEITETIYCVGCALTFAGCYYTAEVYPCLYYIMFHSALLPRINFRPNMVMGGLALHLPGVYNNAYYIIYASRIEFRRIRSLGDIVHYFFAILHRCNPFSGPGTQDIALVCFIVMASGAATKVTFQVRDKLAGSRGY